MRFGSLGGRPFKNPLVHLSHRYAFHIKEHESVRKINQGNKLATDIDPLRHIVDRGWPAYFLMLSPVSSLAVLTL